MRKGKTEAKYEEAEAGKVEPLQLPPETDHSQSSPQVPTSPANCRVYNMCHQASRPVSVRTTTTEAPLEESPPSEDTEAPAGDPPEETPATEEAPPDDDMGEPAELPQENDDEDDGMD